MYVHVNVKNANPNPLLRNKKAHIIIGSVQYVVYCTYVHVIASTGPRPCKCYAKYTPIKITFYPILTDMKHHLFFGVVGGVYCRSSFEKIMTSQHKRKKEENLVTNFEFLGGPMSCFVFQDIFFLRSVWKVEGRGGFLPKKKNK